MFKVVYANVKTGQTKQRVVSERVVERVVNKILNNDDLLLKFAIRVSDEEVAQEENDVYQILDI